MLQLRPQMCTINNTWHICAQNLYICCIIQLKIQILKQMIYIIDFCVAMGQILSKFDCLQASFDDM